VRDEGGVLVAEGSFQITVRRLAAADYPAFRTFLSSLDRALLRPVRLVSPAGRKP
jgi:hypothetical protein